MNEFFQQEHTNTVYRFEDMLRGKYYIHADLFSQMHAVAYFHENDFPILAHAHSFYELNIVTGGEGIHHFEKASFPVKTGDVFIIPPKVKHGYEETKKLTVFHLAFAPAFFQKYHALLQDIHGFKLLFPFNRPLSLENGMNPFPTIPQNDFVYYIHEMNRLAEMCRLDESGILHEGDKCLKILNLLSDLAKLTIVHEEKTPKDVFIDTPSILKAIAYIEKNFDGNFTINELCKIANMSRSSLLKQFSAFCKCTPANYLTRIRIEKACALLRSTNYSIARIAQDCGFYDSSHFTKSFSQVMKMLPKEFRNYYKNESLSSN